MTKMGKIAETAEDLVGPVTVPAEAYVSKDYARAEQDRLWRKTWLQAGRIEEIPEVGSYITYDIGVDSVIITRTGPDEIRAYHNVCPHRGGRFFVADHGVGRAVCPYHGWSYRGGQVRGVLAVVPAFVGGEHFERAALGGLECDGGFVHGFADIPCHLPYRTDVQAFRHAGRDWRWLWSCHAPGHVAAHRALLLGLVGGVAGLESVVATLGRHAFV